MISCVICFSDAVLHAVCFSLGIFHIFNLQHQQVSRNSKMQNLDITVQLNYSTNAERTAVVEKLVHPYYKESQNKNGESARELFTKEHKLLAESGEKWLKDTSNSCMLVSTLVATVVFAAAFTVPGGNDNEGAPMLLQKKSVIFLVFVVSDTVALFSSVTSLLMFLSILTERYAEKDFLESLPKRLIIGLATLFFAIAATMVAFGATLSIVLCKRFNWVSVPITLLASIPVTLFALLQLPLFIQMVRSTFGQSILRPKKLR
ncbi:ankyrin repeat-containing protein NPR4-like [Pyrus communis]|uniref:ankyrin repeat-containing protein NPR4-like n=1 Tax=Pyrus communis TaxID=23211 RepID=UPI0035BF4FA8